MLFLLGTLLISVNIDGEPVRLEQKSYTQSYESVFDVNKRKMELGVFVKTDELEAKNLECVCLEPTRNTKTSLSEQLYYFEAKGNSISEKQDYCQSKSDEVVVTNTSNPNMFKRVISFVSCNLTGSFSTSD